MEGVKSEKRLLRIRIRIRIRVGENLSCGFLFRHSPVDGRQILHQESHQVLALRPETKYHTTSQRFEGVVKYCRPCGLGQNCSRKNGTTHGWPLAVRAIMNDRDAMIPTIMAAVVVGQDRLRLTDTLNVCKAGASTCQRFSTHTFEYPDISSRTLCAK